MIDIHTHILPGIDDGAASLEEAAEMCRLADDGGCKVVVATPHQRHPTWLNTDRRQLESLRQEVEDTVGEALQVALGAEIRVDSELLSDLEAMPGSGVVPLADSRYLLLELDRVGIGPDPESLIHEVIVAGWWPILAHPELIAPLAEDLHLVERLVDKGASLQITAMSLSGDFGAGPRLCCRQLLDAGLVHFVASDAHNPSWRPPGLSQAYRILRTGWGEEMARRLTCDNPEAVIQNRSLPVFA